MIKSFVLDTNVLLHSAQSIESFRDNDVVIPMAVIEELDKFKKNSDELGRNTRQVIRHLDTLRQHGHLRNGVPLSVISGCATGKLYVLTAAEISPETDSGIDAIFRDDLGERSPDNRILRVAFSLHQQGKYVVFISKDINLRLKADALGLRVMDFERGKVDEGTLFQGYRKFPNSGELMKRLYAGEELSATPLNLIVNEYALLTDEKQFKNPAVVRAGADGMLHTAAPATEQVWNLSPRNPAQRMALDLLLNPEIKMVTLLGGAGTGKTLLALAAGLELVLQQKLYDRILVSRPIIPLGNDIGFLPGDKGAKLASWMQPIFDNLEFLLGGENERKPHSSSRYTADGLIGSHKLELEAITYIRGRSIPRQFVIVDEAQNLTPHEIKTIVSRAGEDTKMVLTGDPHQIDNPYLDASSNGLSYAAEHLKGQKLFGHITLEHSERSELAALAARLL